MEDTNIVDWAQSQFGFYVDRYWHHGQWVQQRGPIRLADYHADILRHLFTPDASGRLPYDTISWCEPAKSGKSAVAGLVAEWMALRGEINSSIIMASNKQQQASSIMFKSLADSVQYNPHLPNVEAGKLAVTFSNGNEVKAIASNSRGEAGARFSLAVFDELWGYQYRDSERLWTEFKVDPTRLNSVRFAIGYAGYLESKLWLDLLETGKGGEPVPELAHIVNPDGSPCCWSNGRSFTFWSHQCRQPWQTEAWQAEQRRTLRPAEYQRMIECVFVEGEGDFVDLDAWKACISSDHKPLPPGNDTPVYVGLDLATAPGGDDAAVIAVYQEDGFCKVAFHHVWRGSERKKRLKLTETVRPYLLQAKDKFNLQGVWFDPFQALHLQEELEKAKIKCHPVNQTHSTRGPKDTALYEMIANRQLMLYQHPDLNTLAASANARELGNGLIFLKKAHGRAKIDLLVALSNVADVPMYGKPKRKMKFLSLAGPWPDVADDNTDGANTQEKTGEKILYFL